MLLFFVALLLTAFMPRRFGNIEAHLTCEFPRSILLGIASMAGVPVVLVAFIISIIGILFIPFFLLALIVSFLMGYLVFSRMLGQRLLPGRQIMLQILGGLLLLHGPFLLGDVFLLPGIFYLSIVGHILRGIGSIVFFCVLFIGLGAVVYSLWVNRAPASSNVGEAIDDTPEVAGIKDVEESVEVTAAKEEPEGPGEKPKE